MRTTSLLVIALVLTSCDVAAEPTITSDAAPGTQASRVTVPMTSPPGDLAEVVQVLDGDSLIVAVDGREQQVRLIGVNAPEGDECHGDAARTTLEELVAGGQLVLVSDGQDSDQYGRLLRYLYVDGLNVNQALIANGDAVVLQGDHSLESEFIAIADATAQGGNGMWAPDACGDPDPAQGIAIVDYIYNPPGRDEDNINDEWIAIANVGANRVDMDGWLLRDESTRHRFRFPNGFSLGSSDEVTVHSGCGQNTATDLYWCAGDPVWSNGGDTVILQNQSGNIVAFDRYAGEY